MVIAVN